MSESTIAAVSDLFRSSYSSVVRFAFHSCRSVDLAEEFTQEAFTSYCRSVRAGVTIENPRAWLLKTVRNQLSKHWRFRQRHGDEVISSRDCERLGAVVFDTAFADPKPRNLTDYLSLLSEREEEVLLLRSKGMKYKDIALHLGITTNSVGTLMVRAIRKIREAREKSEPAARAAMF
jgi:RNA polymerase sigma factor (sigma-70 family)